MKYLNVNRNHVIIDGHEESLSNFLNQDYKGMKHKIKNGFSSNSEDALTWSCFDVLRSLPNEEKTLALDELLEDAYEGFPNFSFRNGYTEDEIIIHIGKTYTGSESKETTEVDASIELPETLIFFEAKLYSSISLADEKSKQHYQIAKKLRVGLDCSKGKQFYFIFIDIAPCSELNMRKSKEEALHTKETGFYSKWKSAWWYSYYKYGRNGSLNPLKKCLQGIEAISIENVSANMGWLTWSDLYKIILRQVIKSAKFK